MAAAIPFVMIAGAAVSAIGAIQQGRAAKAAAQFNETIANQNAQIERENTISAVRQFDREQYMRLGAVRASQAKAGGTQQGSVLDILADTAAQGEIARQDLIRQGALRERGQYNTARIERFEGDQAARQSILAAGSELLGGAANAYQARSRLTRA